MRKWIFGEWVIIHPRPDGSHWVGPNMDRRGAKMFIDIYNLHRPGHVMRKVSGWFGVGTVLS